ncbi:MAG: hypothetical protein WD894_14480 [Pirellulales bacterium]
MLVLFGQRSEHAAPLRVGLHTGNAPLHFPFVPRRARPRGQLCEAVVPAELHDLGIWFRIVPIGWLTTALTLSNTTMWVTALKFQDALSSERMKDSVVSRRTALL